jgi:hypothetical protein
MSSTRLQPGDVIMSPLFAYGSYPLLTNRAYQPGQDMVFVDGHTTHKPYQIRLNEAERVQMAAATGQIPPELSLIDLGAYDSTRGEAQFVVINARLAGGGKAHNDIIPDGWQVTARRLNNGYYDPNGEVIYFYTEPAGGGFIDPAAISVVGRMEMRYE